MEVRVGLGFDSHEFEEGKPLFLGGVKIEGEKGLKGHSDGDALLHAIVDALLGAIGEGDIGELFSEEDQRWKGAESRVFLEEALRRVKKKGYEIANIDCVIVSDRPKIAPVKDKIRRRISELTGVSPERISVKGKRREGFSEGEGLVCLCTVLLVR